VLPEDTVYSLNKKTADAGGKMLDTFLDTLDLNDIRTTPQPEGEWPNYTYPDRASLRAFRKKRLRF